jgi:hypothetical protein
MWAAAPARVGGLLAPGTRNSQLARSRKFNIHPQIPSWSPLFLLRQVAAPVLDRGRAIVTHNALRLSCNHAGYGALWREQLDEAWREPRSPFTWPVLNTADERWDVRAAIDAVVADAYGLTRDQYAHVLTTFSHTSYPKAPELCLAKFDELHAIGLDAFTKKYDPYWDIPLNENLPQPVIDLPIASEPVVREQEELFAGKGSGVRSRESGGSAARRRGRRRSSQHG